MAKSHGVQFVKIVDSVRPLIKECTIPDVVKRQAQGDSFVLIDVREESEFAAARIPGAKHIGKGVIERSEKGSGTNSQKPAGCCALLVPDPFSEPTER